MLRYAMLRYAMLRYAMLCSGELEFVSDLRDELARLTAEYEEVVAQQAAGMRSERRRSQTSLEVSQKEAQTQVRHSIG